MFIYVTQKLKFVFRRVGNIVGQGVNAGYQHFLLFPQWFQKASYTGSLKINIVWERINNQSEVALLSNLENSVGLDNERFKEWLVNMSPNLDLHHPLLLTLYLLCQIWAISI